jgi:hypothetical protein
MVMVFLRGGLGNQMFQYALGLELAKKNNTELLLDTAHLRDRIPRKNFTYRNYDLDIFTLDAKFTGISKAANAVPVPGLWLGLDVAATALGELVGMHKVVREKDYQFDPSALSARGNIFLYGRWQSEKYFIEAESDVRAAFRFRHALEGEAASLAAFIKEKNSASLHVRRGDYVSFKNVQNLMGDTNMAYYNKAAAYVAERVKDVHFFVFSDDIEWCKKNIALDIPVTYVSAASEGPKASFHLELMSLCKHNIITNSTFSWWAAWLNANKEKMVIAPKHWLADPSIKEDIVPESWIRI